MIRWLTGRSKPQEVVSLFSRYVSPDVLKQKTLGQLPLNQLTAGPVEYVLVAVKAHEPNRTAENLGTAARVSTEAGWMVQSLMSNTALLVRGTLPQIEGPAISRGELIDRLKQALASDVKSVHGLEQATFGSMGSDTRQTFGALLPSFEAAVRALADVPYGEHKEHRG